VRGADTGLGVTQEHKHVLEIIARRELDGLGLGVLLKLRRRRGAKNQRARAQRGAP
jgi:hypothetical protein